MKILNVVIVLLIIAIPFYGQIYAMYWHAFNENPIKWEGLVVTVPDVFVAEELSYGEKPVKALNLWSYAESEQPHINIHKILKDYSLDEEFLKEIVPDNYTLLERENCFLLGSKCVWMKIARKHRPIEEDDFYREQVWFYSLKHWISYQGYEKNRNYFVEVMNNLKLAEN